MRHVGDLQYFSDVEEFNVTIETKHEPPVWIGLGGWCRSGRVLAQCLVEVREVAHVRKASTCALPETVLLLHGDVVKISVHTLSSCKGPSKESV